MAARGSYGIAKGRECLRDGCSRPVRTRDRCTRHYEADRKSGAIPPLRQSLDGHRICTMCREELPLDRFTQRATRYESACRKCLTEARVERRRNRTEDEKVLEAQRRKDRAEQKKLNNPEGALRESLVRSARLLKLDPELVLRHWEQVGHRCMICKRHPKPGERRFAIDHDHLRGNFRGILCSGCNTMLGHAQDSATILKSAIKYLEGVPVPLEELGLDMRNVS